MRLNIWKTRFWTAIFLSLPLNADPMTLTGESLLHCAIIEQKPISLIIETFPSFSLPSAHTLSKLIEIGLTEKLNNIQISSHCSS
ncbi:hypothetical protein F5146DRAFT_1043497 [Armillaria mellea]|nr:hypothetical protein F5146DRAFT_1043497 [Armillaria mellea]